MTEDDSRIVKDPICGKDVDTLRARAVGIFGGVTYYFCSRSARPSTRIRARRRARTSAAAESRRCRQRRPPRAREAAEARAPSRRRSPTERSGKRATGERAAAPQARLASRDRSVEGRAAASGRTAPMAAMATPDESRRRRRPVAVAARRDGAEPVDSVAETRAARDGAAPAAVPTLSASIDGHWSKRWRAAREPAGPWYRPHRHEVASSPAA